MALVKRSKPSRSGGAKTGLRKKPSRPAAKKRPTRSKKAPAKKSGPNRRSTGGFAEAKRVNAENKRKREMGFIPFRFGLKPDEGAKIVLLDEKPFFMYEHNWESTKGHWDQFDTCIKDSGLCPLCQKLGREGYYVMMLTCIDLRPYEKDGKTIRFTRKLYPVKSTMIPKFERLFKKKDTFRGMVLEVYRDSDKEVRTGGDIEFKGWMNEAKLSRYTRKDREGNTIKLYEPVDYDKAFPYPSSDELSKRYGTGSSAGSEDMADDDDLEGVDWDEDDED